MCPIWPGRISCFIIITPLTCHDLGYIIITLASSERVVGSISTSQLCTGMITCLLGRLSNSTNCIIMVITLYAAAAAAAAAYHLVCTCCYYSKEFSWFELPQQKTECPLDSICSVGNFSLVWL